MGTARKLYISDLHFGHVNVTQRGRNFDNRPFVDTEEMRDKIIDKWNSEVTKADHVYILGDMFWKINQNNFKEYKDIMLELNGNKHLIIGNHDRVDSPQVRKLFEEIKPYKEDVDIVDGKQRTVIMSHYYMPLYNCHYRNAIMLHGHSHNSKESVAERIITKLLNDMHFKCEIYNVGCMQPYIDYAPRTLQYIVDNYSLPKNESDNYIEILALLNKYHTEFPYMRFGQTIVSLLGEDPFYIEDKKTLDILKNKFSNQNEV